MRIAYLSTEVPGRTDLLIAETVARLESRGHCLAGTVATGLSVRPGCDVTEALRVLPDGPVLPIAEHLGPGRGCRLDIAALADAAVHAGRRLDGARAFVLSRFGRLEAQGRGFLPVMAAAMDRGLPVLVGVDRAHLGDFLAFAGDAALALPLSGPAAADWLLTGQPAPA